MGYINKKTREKVYEKYNGHCAYCGKEIKYKEMQVDHLEAQSVNYYNDKHEYDPKYVDRFENLMPSCRRCNHYKRANSLNSYRWLIDTLIERLRKIYIFKVAEDYGIIEFNEFQGLFYFEMIEKGLIKDNEA